MNLAQLSIKRPIFITCIVVLSLILGGVSLKKMSVDLFPDVTFPVIFIQVLYPGASPQDVEKLVAKPIEEELGSISGLNRLSTQNYDSVCIVVLEFKLGSDIKEAEQTVRNRLGNIRRNFPNDIKDPIIRRFDPADQPVISLAVTSKMDDGELYDVINEQIKPQFERIADVGLVEIVGGRKTEIQVNVDKNKIQERRISMLQIARRIEETSKDVPIGKHETSTQETVLRASGDFRSIDEIKNVSVNFLGSDVPVRLKEIADVKIGLADQKRISKFNGSKALTLDIFRQAGTNTVAVVEAVKKKMPGINEYLKKKQIDAEVRLVRDASIPIQDNITDVRESILIGIALCVLVVFLFLGSARSTFITGMALPNSLLGGFLIMYIMGFSINIMTLLALSLAVGLLIDDAIVVRENIFRHLEMGEDPRTAALKGTLEVTQAVIATTLVVIAVFGPIAFLKGIVGQFFKQFGLTIVFTMLISLFDAFTVAPMLSAYFAGKHQKHGEGNGIFSGLLSAFDRLQSWLEERYEATLRFSIRRPLFVLFSTILIFFGSLFLGKYIPKTFLPANDIGEFSVDLEMPVGSSLQEMERIADEIDQLLRDNPSVNYTLASIGSKEQESNVAKLYVKLVERKKRPMTTSAFKEVVRKMLASQQSGVKINVSDIDISGGGQKPFNLNLVGENLEELSSFAEKLKKRLSQIPGLVDVDSNFRTGKPEFQVLFDREKSERLGISTGTAGMELRYRTEGAEPAVFRRNGIEYKIRARLAEPYRNLKEQFASTVVPNQNYDAIPLSRVAQGKETLGYSQINRENKNRFINISANLGAGGALGNITDEIERILAKELPPPQGIDHHFMGQAEDFKDLLDNMVVAIGLGVIFIYLVLASLYESFVIPFSILLALPMAVSGVMVFLLVFHKTIDIFSLIGIVMLLGVVAKNSILLVDYTMQLMAEGMSRPEALVKAGRTRLRPILMTTLALVAGTIPIAIGLNEASKMRTSMGVAIIGGLISSTALTLIVVPAAFGYLDDFRRWINRKFKLTT